ncbi:NAD(P)-binding domain-containing protein [Streptomyces sp. NPDC047315]|uniref:NAD(P)-dependent oxidoreductase n=1 Tax=Streptomyces sp. NPDC047315 TaxID=3155142 RepID=UPI0033EA27B2
MTTTQRPNPISPASTSPTPTSPAPVSLLGLGPMGVALADVLLERGHRLTVWNRTRAKADAVVARGAHRAETAADAVAAAPLVLVCLKDYDAMYDALADAEAAPGSVIVNLNSGTPQEARDATAWAAERGYAYLDGVIMVPPFLVGKEGAVLLYSGPRAPYDEHLPALRSLGDPRHLGTDPALAVIYNTALLGMMYATMNGWLHATALADSAGVSAADFADLALGWFMPTVVTPASMHESAPALDRADYPGDLGTLEMNLTALDHIVRTSEQQGVPADHPRQLQATAQAAVTLGHGQSNYLAVYEAFKSPSRPAA